VAPLVETVPFPAEPVYRRGRALDEAIGPDGSPRPRYADLIDALHRSDLAGLSQAVRSRTARERVEFGRESRRLTFPLDPVPRILDSAEWRLLSDGLTQRVATLNAFLADVYDERRILRAGIVPPWLFDDPPFLERDLLGLPHAPIAHIAGLDVVRAPDGELLVLEDNLRTPSGAAYLLAARRICDPLLPLGPPPERLPVGFHLTNLFADTLLAAAPAGRDPVVVLLSDGSGNSAWWEHRQLARLIGVPLVEPGDLKRIGNRLHARIDRRLMPVDVVYRRTDQCRLREPGGRLSWLGDAMLEPLRAGTLACVNGFGTGVADDKLVHAYVEDMVRFYLGEEPLLRSVPTYDPRNPDQRTGILERIDELVVKPRDGFGGAGVIICPHAPAADRMRACNLIARQARNVVAQEMVELSTCPTVRAGRLVPRHVDLRAFVFTGSDGPRALPGGLTRVALEPGSLVVNSNQNGGGKDTWILA
jgi:uncharacterized circularly permuted ATP-grasp superfamily protein